MNSSRTVGFYAAFGATHRYGRLGRIQSFPVTQQEGFALTCREFAKRLFD